MQSLSVYIDTLLICTCSAMMVLIFYVQDPAAAAALNGMPLVQLAVNNSVGVGGIHFVTFAIFAFAFSSLIGNYFYAESNLRFIFGGNKAVLTVFRLLCLVVIFFGCLSSFDLAWNLADIFMGFMAVINLVTILIIGKWALCALDDYTAQRKLGKDPLFRGQLDRGHARHGVLASRGARASGTEPGEAVHRRIPRPRQRPEPLAPRRGEAGGFRLPSRRKPNRFAVFHRS